MSITTSNPIAAVRAAAGLSRVSFAVALGITAAAVQHYENGRAKLPAEIASKIEARFGVSAASLLSGVKPTMIGGKPVTRDAIQKWQAASSSSRENFERDAEELARRLRVLLEAVAPEEYLFCLLSLEHAIDNCARSAPAEAIAAVERQRAEVVRREMTVAELEKELGPSPVWQAFTAEHKPKPRERAQALIETFPKWFLPKERAALLARCQEQGAPGGVAYSVHVSQSLYRITLTNGQKVDVPINSFKVSLVGRAAIRVPARP
jgi:transcriptional regulator with XRE-family HTH domain